MPNRIIKESINESRGLSGCSIFADDLFKRLITYADDYGRFNADTMIMRARLYAREYESVSEQDIVDGLCELVGAGKIQFYTPQVFNQFGKKGVYGAFPNWNAHQRVRESKAKCPDPDDTSVNDWYLRRFVPVVMKAQIIERDGFKCCECGKYVTSCRDAKRFVRLAAGLYHIDHIVPCVQGGRATMENLRLLCPECNLKRKKKYTFDEILEFANGEASEISPQLTAACRNSPPESEAELESESQSEKEPRARDAVEEAELSDPVKAKLREWLEYKRERKEAYKPTGLRSLVSQVQKAEKTLGSTALIDAIDRAMANGWKGMNLDTIRGKPPDMIRRKYDFGAIEKELS